VFFPNINILKVKVETVLTVLTELLWTNVKSSCYDDKMWHYLKSLTLWGHFLLHMRKTGKIKHT